MADTTQRLEFRIVPLLGERAMASGVREHLNAGIGIGVTGIAGRGGGSQAKPVGLVYFALVARDGTTATREVRQADREGD
jgi:nicotinamide-nucleotide amidase